MTKWLDPKYVEEQIDEVMFDNPRDVRMALHEMAMKVLDELADWPRDRWVDYTGGDESFHLIDELHTIATMLQRARTATFARVDT